MSKRNIIITIIVVLIVAVVITITANFLARQGSSEYSLVKLTTGELYVGRLSWFPRPAMRNAHLFQITADPEDATKQNPQLMPVSESLWAPKVIYFNPEQIVIRGHIGKDSAIAKTLRGK
ncbi:hypothetical protein A3I25_01385 [Candidatus Nomurabacteria bacterium RIFCSPLOWO2_02_FULL_42_17]|uniref:Uncharacterized protein n=1 Tax=Candidatus Nomurabacteria bacterium RIFCSPLOWO2_02_FULL_42_17 TaxID=1801789 RepID=A0A1F6XRV2_9BACT|nr:MAG: hypothetical protein UX37_C0010G0008 [Microgenomates group bacterium GW2011_GWA2_46_16]OGI96793.1 MAG: hypothetical protein A3I25_01385 [Candidatus Nomurabacteria bacterium RIFCSPLOWO2_02_FULL_42_17]